MRFREKRADLKAIENMCYKVSALLENCNVGEFLYLLLVIHQRLTLTASNFAAL